MYDYKEMPAQAGERRRLEGADVCLFIFALVFGAQLCYVIDRSIINPFIKWRKA